MIIRNNTMGLRAYNSNRKTVSSMSKNLEKLSSGYRINRAADDAAGLGVSEHIRLEVTELDRCQRNATEGIDLARTADAALQEINDMLKRARELCIEAANGTYSEQELAEISSEMNHLFDEVDRISAGSYHNTICLFRQDVGQTYHEEYDEQFNALAPDQLDVWGVMETIETADFDEAKKATAATATFKLSDAINFSDPTTLEGKSIKIGNQTFYFSSKADYSSGTTFCQIGTGANAVEDALKKLTLSSDVASVSVDKAARTVTLTGALKPLSETIEADGRVLNSVAQNGDGGSVNGTVVDNPQGDKTILQVDGSGPLNNAPERSNTLTGSFPLTIPGAALTADNVANLKQNTLQVYDQNITFTDSTSPGKNQVAIRENMTKAELGQAIAAAISGIDKYQATYDAGKSTLDVTYTRSGNSSVSLDMRIRESPGVTSSQGTHYDTANRWTSTGMQFSIQTTAPTLETGGSCSVTIPSVPSGPFSFRLGSTNYLYYNSDTNPLTSADHPRTDYSTGTPVLCDMKGKSAEQIQADIANRIKSYASASGSLSGVSVTTSGNTVTFKSSTPGQTVDLRSSLSGVSITVTPYRPSSATVVKNVLNSSTYYFKETYEIPFSLGPSFDKDALAGRGFTLKTSQYTTSARRFEFTNGSGGLQAGYTDVDISGCSSFDDLKNVLQTALGSTYTVSIDSSDPSNVKLKIGGTRSVNNDLPSILDGAEGITDGNPVVFEGGENTNHSQKSIDFSGINADNLDTLLGKGFRINCATCSGEYINVFFCWTNDGSAPLTFERRDPTTGEMRTIHNIPVELSKITSGDRIVENIVEQVRPSLNHYTDVTVGDPPTTLIAIEKRVGDVRDNAGKLYLGSVQSGVESNFTYSVSKKLVPDLPEGNLKEFKTAEVNIYVGSEPGPQYIPIHLPYIDLYQMRLRPPEFVDLTDDTQDPSNWLARVDCADVAISSARGTIGADYNRLEHTVQDLSNAHTQLSDAYSVIRDADMAELMVQQVKDQILVQMQQSMLSQANQTPQGVLQLMQ